MELDDYWSFSDIQIHKNVLKMSQKRYCLKWTDIFLAKQQKAIL